MSKFKVNVKLQGYEVKLGSVEFSVEGEKVDAQKVSQEIERQLSGMIHAPAVMTPTVAQLAAIPLKGAAQGIPIPPEMGHPGLSGAVGQLRSLGVQIVTAHIMPSLG